METLSIAQAPATEPVYPREYSQRRCTACTQYHGKELCDLSMLRHILRNA